MENKTNLQLFGAQEMDCADEVLRTIENYEGMTTQEGILISILAELTRMNDNLGCLETQLSTIGRLTECINEQGQFCVTGLITTYEG